MPNFTSCQTSSDSLTWNCFHVGNFLPSWHFFCFHICTISPPACHLLRNPLIFSSLFLPFFSPFPQNPHHFSSLARILLLLSHDVFKLPSRFSLHYTQNLSNSNLPSLLPTVSICLLFHRCQPHLSFIVTPSD